MIPFFLEAASSVLRPLRVVVLTLLVPLLVPSWLLQPVERNHRQHAPNHCRRVRPALVVPPCLMLRLGPRSRMDPPNTWGETWVNNPLRVHLLRALHRGHSSRGGIPRYNISLPFHRKLEEYPSNPILGPRHMGSRSPTLLIHTHACEILSMFKFCLVHSSASRSWMNRTRLG